MLSHGQIDFVGITQGLTLFFSVFFLLFVMVPELSDIQVIIGNLVDNSMLVIDASGPIARQIMSQ